MTTRTSIYKGNIIDLGIESVNLPDGRRIELEIVRHPGGAAALAMDKNNRMALIRQYRHAAGGWLWEIPAGKIDPGENPLKTAQRELQEEAGIVATSWISIGAILSTPGFCDEVIHLFFAQDLACVPRNLSEHELIELHWIPFKEAHELALNGEIRDAKTLITVFRVAELLNPQK